MIAMRPRRLRRLLALAASAAVLAAVGVAFVFTPEAHAATPAAGAVIFEPAYSVLSWFQFLGNLVVTVVLSGVIAVCLIVAVLWLWDLALEFVLPIRRWLR